MRKCNDSISIALIAVSAVIVAFYLNYSGALDTPENSGGWFYAYQNIFAGIFAIIGGLIAYEGAIKPIKWQESLLEEERKKLIEDLRADSSLAIFNVIIIDRLIQKNMTKHALELIQDQIPLELGYKFTNDSAIEKLASNKRNNARGMVKWIEKYNEAMLAKDFRAAYEVGSNFYIDYTILFDDDLKEINNLCDRMVDLVVKANPS